MHNGGRKIAVILGLLLLFALVGAASAAGWAEGCKWVDANKNGTKDANELCEAGWTLHVKVTNASGTIREEDFVTNSLGPVQSGTNKKWAYQMPPAVGTYTAVFTETPPPGYVVVAPSPPTYTKTYTSTTNVTGISFGNQPVTYTADGCYWIDTAGSGVYNSQTCQAGQTLHALVTDGTNTIIEQDFTTNTAGANGKFSYTLPVIPAGATYYVTISEVPPNGYVVTNPTGAGKPPTYSYTKSYTSATTVPVGGFTFGNYLVSASAEGCFWKDLNGNKQKDDNEPCETGRTLHVTVTDDQGKVQKDVDFVTDASGNAADSTSFKFVEPLPVPSTGKTWTCMISELVTPAGYLNFVPGGDVPSYSMSYSALDPAISGFSFGHSDPPVPVPEFPTVAVSILTISGMVIAVQFIKKRN
jgi:hypothetical protein